MFNNKKKSLFSNTKIESKIEESVTYSVLIHFTTKMEYVYLLEEEEFVDYDGGVLFSDDNGHDYQIRGSFVYANSLDSKADAEKFVEKYKLTQPIWFNF